MGRTYELYPQLGPARKLQNMTDGSGEVRGPIPRAQAITANGVCTVLACIYCAPLVTFFTPFPREGTSVPNSCVSMERLTLCLRKTGLPRPEGSRGLAPLPCSQTAGSVLRSSQDWAPLFTPQSHLILDLVLLE